MNSGEVEGQIPRSIFLRPEGVTPKKIIGRALPPGTNPPNNLERLGHGIRTRSDSLASRAYLSIGMRELLTMLYRIKFNNALDEQTVIDMKDGQHVDSRLDVSWTIQRLLNK